ncbi:hypothetical protein [Pelagibacterium lacus]|uniref:Uncharacterized protein n=1 Tax=Pelagibacterium lacus TaxID=2282655 RepID=A0A369W1B1_9HYPH|nr:hypothetical protein [Pelagibacterium lacus]RDE07675.1 hypothetical protein DVH29_15450 [Pelagibacterium lacus]
MKTLIQAFIVLPPLLAAFAAAALFWFLVLGLSAFSGTEQETAANVALLAMLSYMAAYAGLAVIVTLCVWSKWRIAGLFHVLIWLCFLSFAGTMAWALSVLLAG